MLSFRGRNYTNTNLISDKRGRPGKSLVPEGKCKGRVVEDSRVSKSTWGVGSGGSVSIRGVGVVKLGDHGREGRRQWSRLLSLNLGKDGTRRSSSKKSFLR